MKEFLGAILRELQGISTHLRRVNVALGMTELRDVKSPSKEGQCGNTYQGATRREIERAVAQMRLRVSAHEEKLEKIEQLLR